MKKPKMLYASPFMPLKSGISDYSAILIYLLKEEFDVTLYIDDYEIKDKNILADFKVLKYKKDVVNFNGFQYLIYNIGNNPEYHSFIYETCLEYPGMVILHDVVLYYLFVGYYQSKNELYSKIYEVAGIDAVLQIKEAVKMVSTNLLEQKYLAAKMPLNQELLKSSNKFMVHSRYAFDAVAKYTNKVRKINMVQQVAGNIKAFDKKMLMSKYSLPENALILASFGIIAESKLNHIICKTVNKICNKMGQRICYVMVGEGNYVNKYVDNHVIFKTGFVDMDEFDSFIANSDIVLNLRYPSMGETSAVLVKALQIGKCCIINDDGWFSEIPDDCAVKISVQNIENQLQEKLDECIYDGGKRKKIADNARSYIEREYDRRLILNNIKSFLNE